jgi:inner membrane protein
MMELIQGVAPHWLWLGLGVLLCAIEIVAPGFFLMWLGLAALATGAIAALTGVGVAGQLGLFGLFAIASIYFARSYFGKNPITSDDPMLNDRAARLKGEVVVVSEAITNGHGRAIIGDSVWSVRGADAPQGARVRVTGVDGSTLLIELA